MEGRGQCVPCDQLDRAAGRDDRDRQAVLEHHTVGRTDASEEFPVRRAATQEHVLAVVEPGTMTLERPSGAAQAGAALEQPDRGAGVRARERRAQAGEAATDDHDPGPAHAPTRFVTAGADRSSPAMLRPAIHTFSHVGSDTRPSSTAPGRAVMRVSSRR